MSFVDASVIVSILNEEPGFEELEKRLGKMDHQLYVSPLVRFEAVAALARMRIATAEGKVNRDEIITEARMLVDSFFQAIQANEIAIDTPVGQRALDAMARYGKVAGHRAELNFGDCFAYAAAKAYRVPLVYKGDDFTHTDLA